MLQILNSSGIEIVLLEQDGLKVAMPINSLLNHLERHSDIAPDYEGYLREAITILSRGKPYKNGKIHEGIFISGYNSQELEAYVVTTVHRKFQV